MSERRMFSISIVNSDRFLDLDPAAQMLYFHYAMRADDDGFLENPRTVRRMVGASAEDYNALVENGYIIEFPDAGAVVITHWLVHNRIQSDRKKDTAFQKELGMLAIENNVYRMKTEEELRAEREAAGAAAQNGFPPDPGSPGPGTERGKNAENGAAAERAHGMDTNRKQNGNGSERNGNGVEAERNEMRPQDRLGKYSIDKYNTGYARIGQYSIARDTVEGRNARARANPRIVDNSGDNFGDNFPGIVDNFPRVVEGQAKGKDAQRRIIQDQLREMELAALS